VVNSRDLGRQIQQSYYSGPATFDPRRNQASQWKPWPWNPIQSGDCFGHRAAVLSKSNNGRQIYVKTRPMQWALNNVPAQATFETWITLEDHAAWVRCRLKNHRTDTKRQFVGYYHECPAVLTVGTLHRLFTYEGLEPFAKGKLAELPRSPPPWRYFQATENWAAHVDRNNWGVGVFHPGAVLFSGGFHGRPGAGGPDDDPVGYMAPIRGDVLDHNIVYDYRYALILGTLSQIRDFVYAHRPDRRPDYRFLVDRQHWFCLGGDAGFPMKGCLRMNLAGSCPTLLGPPTAWRAADVPRLYIKAAYHLSNSAPETAVARLYWKVNQESMPWVTEIAESQSVTFPVIADGQYHVYALDLASCPAYQGTITQLRFDPVVRGSAGDTVDVKYITWRSDLTSSEPSKSPNAGGVKPSTSDGDDESPPEEPAPDEPQMPETPLSDSAGDPSAETPIDVGEPMLPRPRLPPSPQGE